MKSTLMRGIPKGTPFGAGPGWREARKIEKPASREAGEFFGNFQSSSGIITVMAGCGASISSGPQVAMSLTSFGARLSLRT